MGRISSFNGPGSPREPCLAGETFSTQNAMATLRRSGLSQLVFWMVSQEERMVLQQPGRDNRDA